MYVPLHCREIRIILFCIVSKQEIESLCTIFRHLAKGGDKGKFSLVDFPYSIANLDKIDRNRFRDILHNTFDMTDDILMDRGKIIDENKNFNSLLFASLQSI